MKKITLLFLLSFITSINTYSQRNQYRKTVGVHQLDPRFTFSIEKYWSGMADAESYYYYVKNNTADEYKLEIEVDLTLNCYDVKPTKLGINRVVYLKPYGEFTPDDDWVHNYMISSDKEKQKSCLIAEGETYTLYRSHTWQILSVVNMTQKKANEQKQKNDQEQARLQKIADDKKANEDKLRLQKIESEKIAKQEAQKQAQNTSNKTSNTTNYNSSYNSGSTTNSTSRNTTNSDNKLSEKVKVNGQYVQVFQQNGKNYIKNADGSVHETSAIAYNTIMAESDKKLVAATKTQTTTQTAPQAYNTTPTQPLNNYNSSTGLYSNPLINNLSNLNSGSKEIDNYAKNYAQAQQAVEVATALVSLFTPSPEQRERKERERLEAERIAEEQRQIQLQRRIENENNAKADFQTNILNKYNINDENDRVDIVVLGIDKYISDKYNYDIKEMTPDWKKWINESIQNNNKYASTIFAGKTLGLNTNKFDYKVDLTTDQAVSLLEKLSNSETEYRPYLGITWKPSKETIKISKPKKKTINKEINVFKVTNVMEGTAAFDNDLKEGDIISKINNNHIEDIGKTIKESKIGDKVDITFLRNGKEYTKKITLGKTIKDNYNVDAMIILANYYNNKNKGNNPEKALYYFTKAAEKGSPNAMYSLGEIYQKNVFGDKKENVKYKFKKNEEFALEWYNKSISYSNYPTSHIHSLYGNGTYFEPKAYDELEIMYKKGIGCEKNTVKSNEISNLKMAYLEKMKKESLK